MKVLEALASGIAAEGIDRIFGVIGDANQEIIVELWRSTGSNSFIPTTKLPPSAWRTVMRAFPARLASPRPRKALATPMLRPRWSRRACIDRRC